MTLNQLFYSFGKFLLNNKPLLSLPVNSDLLKKFTDIIEEKFARIEEKSSVVQSENSILKERLFLRLVFTLLSTIENNSPELREVNRIIETNLFSFSRTRFKCLNSSVLPADCWLKSPVPADNRPLPDHLLQQERGLPECCRGESDLRLEATRGHPHPPLLLQRPLP